MAYCLFFKFSNIVKVNLLATAENYIIFLFIFDILYLDDRRSLVVLLGVFLGTFVYSLPSTSVLR